MFLIPLGLKARTRQIPFVTVLITVSTVMVSVPHFEKLHRYEKQYAESSKPVFRARENLLLTTCEATDLENLECEAVKDAFAGRKPEAINVSLGRLKTAIEGRYSKKDVNKHVSRIAAYLTDDAKWGEIKTSLQPSAELSEYTIQAQTFEKQIVLAQKENDLFSAGNFSLKTLLLAEWTHGGWLHLFGNMLIFVLLAIPVEQRLGSLFFSLLYAAGGTLGLGLQVLAYGSSTKILLGASANVFAVMGAFLALFWMLEMRVWLSIFFVYNRVVFIPTWLFIPCFVLLGEFAGVISSVESGVAHLAHLIGCACGLGLAFIFAKFKSLPLGYAFDFEHALMTKATHATDAKEKLQALWELLFYNPHNLDAQRLAIDATTSFEDPQWATLPIAGKQILATHFGPVLDSYLTQKPGELAGFLARVPESWPSEKLAARVNPTHVRQGAEFLTAEGKLEPALRLYELYIAIVPSDEIRFRMTATIDDLKKRIAYEKLAA